MPFEEVKDEEPKAPDFKLPTLKEMVETFVGGFFVTVLAAGVAGLCWNHVAHNYFDFLPAKWQNIGWLDAFCFFMLLRTFAVALEAMRKSKDG